MFYNSLIYLFLNVEYIFFILPFPPLVSFSLSLGSVCQARYWEAVASRGSAICHWQTSILAPTLMSCYKYYRDICEGNTDWIGWRNGGTYDSKCGNSIVDCVLFQSMCKYSWHQLIWRNPEAPMDAASLPGSDLHQLLSVVLLDVPGCAEHPRTLSAGVCASVLARWRGRLRPAASFRVALFLRHLWPIFLASPRPLGQETNRLSEYLWWDHGSRGKADDVCVRATLLQWRWERLDVGTLEMLTKAIKTLTVCR